MIVHTPSNFQKISKIYIEIYKREILIEKYKIDQNSIKYLFSKEFWSLETKNIKKILIKEENRLTDDELQIEKKKSQYRKIGRVLGKDIFNNDIIH